MENNFHLTNKSSLFRNMKRYYESIGRDPYEVLPITFHIKKGCTSDDPEYDRFLAKYKEIEDSKLTRPQQSMMYEDYLEKRYFSPREQSQSTTLQSNRGQLLEKSPFSSRR